MNRGFVDGNKRVGYAAMEIFLGMNDAEIVASNSEIEAFILTRLGDGTFNKDVLDAWLRANNRPA